MDSDLHKIKDFEGNILNDPQPIIIGNNVWLGCRSIILKGTNIPDNCVVGTGSLVNKSFTGANQVIAGNPCIPLRQNIEWEY